MSDIAFTRILLVYILITFMPVCMGCMVLGQTAIIAWNKLCSKVKEGKDG